jgi:hypothetical protein
MAVTKREGWHWRRLLAGVALASSIACSESTEPESPCRVLVGERHLVGTDRHHSTPTLRGGHQIPSPFTPPG